MYRITLLLSQNVFPYLVLQTYSMGVILIIYSKRIFNPIRSGLFQTANDPGGGGGALNPPPPTISKTIVSIFTISYMCILPGVSGISQLEF